MKSRGRLHTRTEDDCLFCTPVLASMIDELLLTGHAYPCVLWHLRRLSVSSSLDALVAHMELHRPFSLLPDEDHVHVHQWAFVPPALPPMSCDTTPELLLIRGLPQTGKTRLACTYATTHVHIEADQYFFRWDGKFSWEASSVRAAHLWAKLWTDATLRARQNVVVANTFVTNTHLESYYAIAAKHGATVRILTTGSTIPDTSHIPLATLERYRRLWEDVDLQPHRWRVPISLETDPCPGDIPAMPTISVFCQPHLCRHMLGQSWLSRVATAMDIAVTVRDAKEYPVEFLDDALRLAQEKRAASPREPASPPFFEVLQNTLSALVANTQDLARTMEQRFARLEGSLGHMSPSPADMPVPARALAHPAAMDGSEGEQQ